ncbi:MAG: hypothetical protein F4Y78_07660 [Candidatus Dadabacteria bacterium]|nr:hypothetical protein [Candidatus Dadabacteria bacterium]MYA48935.1 hypothetical protein [Candidatus Dadabacteria bacterium]MYK49321.1 hypothetical protein [Candidatus Dadabacteria bacterium]
MLKILGYVAVLVLVGIGVWLLWVFVTNINSADPSVKAGLIGLLGMFLVALFTNYQTKKREIDARHFADKREGYTQFIDMLFDFIKSSRNNKELTEKEMLSKIIPFKKALLIWGGSNTIKAWNQFEIKSSDKLAPEKALEEMEKILREIRKDLGHDDSELESGNLLGLFLIAEDKKKLLGVELELRKLVPLSQKLEDSGFVRANREPQKQKRHIYAFESVVGGDPNLLLSGLRIEIESRLREIARNKNIKADKVSLRKLTDELIKKEVLSVDDAASIKDLLPPLNKAAHGVNVDKKTVDWALEFGPRLLDALEDRLGETDISKLVERWKDRDGAASAEVGTELSKALVRAPRAFMKAMRDDPESYDSWLKGIAQHTFTIYESRGEVENDLYIAYYKELKQLMISAAETLIGGEFESEAQQILNVLEAIDISRIW